MTETSDNHTVLLRRGDYRMMEWKNGRGRSAEIAIFPSESSFSDDPFLWRLSSAHVTDGGPFSQFPSYSRYLTLVKGESLKLRFEEREERETVLRKGDVCLFSGDESVTSEVVSGGVTDLNLIFRLNEVHATFETIKLSNKSRSFQTEGRAAFVFGISGTVEVVVYPGEKTYKLQEGDTLHQDFSSNNSDEY